MFDLSYILKSTIYFQFSYLINFTSVIADDGTLYFDEKHVDGSEYKGPLTTSASVVRGVSAFAAAASGNLNVSLVIPWEYDSSTILIICPL